MRDYTKNPAQVRIFQYSVAELCFRNLCLVVSYRDHAEKGVCIEAAIKLAYLFAVEVDEAVDCGVEGIVAALLYVFAATIACAALTDKDAASMGKCALKDFNAKPFAV